MKRRRLTWQSVAVATCVLVAVVVTFALFGDVPASVMAVACAILKLAFLRRGRVRLRGPCGPPRPVRGPLCAAAILVAAQSSGCGVLRAAADRSALDALSTKLAWCRAEGRTARSFAAYEACKRREGIAAEVE